MPRRFTLVALWAVFAVASVSVGFAAASVVSDPFTDVANTAEGSDLAGPGVAAVTEPDGIPTYQASGSTPSSIPTTATSGGKHSAGPTKPSTTGSSASIVKRGIPTRGGYVSATCRDGLVSVGAAPAISWRVDSITSGPARTARVRLEPVQNTGGERVLVTATCPGGTPTLTQTPLNISGGDDDGDDHGGGGGDDGGSDSSDDSSDSGSG